MRRGWWHVTKETRLVPEREDDSRVKRDTKVRGKATDWMIYEVTGAQPKRGFMPGETGVRPTHSAAKFHSVRVSAAGHALSSPLQSLFLFKRKWYHTATLVCCAASFVTLSACDNSGQRTVARTSAFILWMPAHRVQIQVHNYGFCCTETTCLQEYAAGQRLKWLQSCQQRPTCWETMWPMPAHTSSRATEAAQNF